MAEEPAPKRTALYEAHVAAGARMAPFAGWEMPIQYSGVIDEVRAVRAGAGLFDVSHMGELHLSGAAALAWLNSNTTNDVARLEVGQAHYSLILNEEAGILDDVLVYRLEQTGNSDEFMVVVNAGNTDKIRDVLADRLVPGVDLSDSTPLTSLLALQGPAAEAVLQKLTEAPLAELRRFRFTPGEVAGIPVVISRTGYTGGEGFELYTQEDPNPLWAALLEAGEGDVKPAGLGARDVCRIEAGNVLYGHEIWEEVNPLSARLMFAVKMEKGPFTGSEALQEMIDAGAALQLAGFTMEGRVVPRQEYPIHHDGEEVGFVTSGTRSPMLEASIGLGYLPPGISEPGTPIAIIVRERSHAATVTKLPFFRAPRK